MKKIMMLLFAALLLCTVAFAAQDYVVWDFRDHDNVNRWVPTGSTEVMVTKSGTVISGVGDALYLSYTPQPNEEIVLDDYTYFAAAVANPTYRGTFQFYHWSEGCKGNPYLHFKTDPTQEGVQYFTCDLTTEKPSTTEWSGKVTSLRFDPFRGSPQREILIIYIGIFKDKAAFEEFKKANPVSGDKPYVVEPNVTTGVEPIIWDFTKASDVALWQPTATCSAVATEKGMKWSGTGDNINYTFTPADGQNIRLEDYPYVSIGYSDYNHTGTFQLYQWTTATTGNPRLEQSHMPANTRGELFFDMITAPPGVSDWQGTVTRLRLDPSRRYSDAPEARNGYIEYIGLFPDEKSYINFKKDKLEDARVLNAGKKNVLFGVGDESSEITYTENSAVVTGVTELSMAAADTRFDGSENGWMKLRIKNTSDLETLNIHFASKASRNRINPSTLVSLPISTNNDDFVEYIVDMRALNLASVSGTYTLTETMWAGTISQIRFSCPLGKSYEIDYIAFCKSESEARAFTPSAESEIEKPAINSGKANPVWILDENNVNQISAGGLDISSEGGLVVVRPITGDPTMSFTLDDSEAFDAEEFPFFAIRHNIKSTVKTLGIFFTTTKLTSLSDESWSPMRIRGDGTWQNTIADLSDVKAYPKNNWHGECAFFRLDPINGRDLDAVIYIDRMGFFRTRSEAYQFLSEGRSEADYTKGATFYNQNTKAVVPAGHLFKGYTREDFIITSYDEGEKGSRVVMYTDENETKTVVPLSYEGSYGYTTYIAENGGKYSLENNDKQFIDTADHWAEDAVRFVSSHDILNGVATTEFAPDMPMTRGMMVTALGRIKSVDTSLYGSDTGFTDVNPDEYYAPYIKWALEKGIIAQSSDSKFRPEQPITRLEAAVMINSFYDVFGYTPNLYNDAVTYDDYEGLDQDLADALNKSQQAGIMQGISDDEFDPDGIITRGDAAILLRNTIKGALEVNTATTQYTPEYFSRKRLRVGAWGFASNFGNKEGMEKLRDLGVDLIVTGTATTSANTKNDTYNYADKFGIEVFSGDFPGADKVLEGYDFSKLISYYGEHPSFSGHYVTDEPGTDDFPKLGAASAEYSKQTGKRPFVNLLPMYANAAQLKFGAGAAAIEYYDPDPELYRKHCQAWFENFDVDYICTDIYPLNGTTGIENRSTWYTYKDYCESINQIATVARENDAEFWCCIQTWGWTKGKRTPTEGEYRWQCYSMLSYGCTGILLWSLTTNSRDYPSVFNTYTNTVTQPTYDDCAKVMWEMRNLSDVYIQYKNLGAVTMNCTDATPWLKMSGQYYDFEPIDEAYSNEPLLIGCFEKENGPGYAFTLVNMTDLKDNKPAYFEFTLTSPATVTLYRKAEPVVLKPDRDGYYFIDLESTEGVFVTVG